MDDGRVPWADAHGYLLSPHSRLSRRLAHAAYLQMSNGFALGFGLPGFGAAAFAALLPYVTFSDGSPRALARGIFQIEKHVSPCSVVGLVRAANAAVDVGYPARPHLRAILIELRMLRPRVAPGANPGSYRFCANPAAYAANRKHPFRKRIAPSTTPAAKTAISKHPSETHSVSKTPPTSSTQCDQSFSSNSTTSPITLYSEYSKRTSNNCRYLQQHLTRGNNFHCARPKKPSQDAGPVS